MEVISLKVMKNLTDQRIILATEIFYPEESATGYILTKIAGELAKEFDLLVLTGPANYEASAHRNAAPAPIEDAKILRFWAPGLSKNHLLGRIIRFLILTVNLSFGVLIKARPADQVFAVTNPAPLMVALALVRKIRPFQLVFLVHDIFPENAAAAGLLRRDTILYSFIRRVFDWAYRSADAIIVIGRDMADVIVKKSPLLSGRITVIENWSDYPLVDPVPRSKSMIPQLGLSEHIVVQYAGNFGRTQGLLEFVELALSVENNNIRFVFRGAGAISSAILSAVDGRSDFIIAGPYPRSEQAIVLGGCDVALVVLGAEMYGLGVPSKAYNILAAGKPLLFLGPRDSEIYRLVKDHDLGWAFDWGEANQLIKLLNNWSIQNLQTLFARGKNARRLAETRFTEKQQLDKFRTFFRNNACQKWRYET